MLNTVRDRKKNLKRCRDSKFLDFAMIENVADPGNLNLINSSIEIDSSMEIIEGSKCLTIETENVAVPGNLNEIDPSIEFIEYEIIEESKCYVADPGQECIEYPSMESDPDNHQVDNEVMKALMAKSIANDITANHQVFTKDVDNPSLEENYYEEIFHYLTSAQHSEDQLDCDLDFYLKAKYPLWNARHLSNGALETKLITRFKIEITYRSLNGLMKTNWIRDDIICCMVEIINLMFYCLNKEHEKPTVHCWNTFFSQNYLKITCMTIIL